MYLALGCLAVLGLRCVDVPSPQANGGPVTGADSEAAEEGDRPVRSDKTPPSPSQPTDEGLLARDFSPRRLHVNPRHPQASDSHDGTLDRPLATLQRAADLVEPGDTVLAAASRYTLDTQRHRDPVLDIRKGGTAEAPIVFAPLGEGEVLIDAQGEHFQAVWIRADHVRVEGFTVTGGKRRGLLVEDAQHVTLRRCIARDNAVDGHGSDGGFQIVGRARDCLIEHCESFRNGTGFVIGVKRAQSNPQRCTIRDSVAHHNQVDDEDSDGISLVQVKDCSVIRCVAYNNADDGINTQGPACDNITLDRCVAYNNDPDRTEAGDGNGFKLSVGGPSSGCVVTRCVAFDNASRGFDDGDAVGTVYRHNTAFRNGRWGFLFEGRECIAENNLAAGNYASNPSPGAACDAKVPQAHQMARAEHNLWADGVFIDGQDRGSIKGDPGFVSPGDVKVVLDVLAADFADVPGLHLETHSVGIDAGKDVGRPFLGKAPDLGAFEAR